MSTDLKLAALLAVLLLAGCSRPQSETAAVSTSPVLARVGETVIRVADLEAEAHRRMQAGRPVSGKEDLLREMVSFEVLLQRARKVGVADDPDVRRELGRLLIGKLKDKELLPRLDAVQVSDEDVKAEYESHLARYTEPAKVRLAALFVKGNLNMSEAKKAELTARLAEARRRILESPAPGGRGPAAIGFGALAVEYSEDQASRYRGGDIGWMAADQPAGRWPEDVLKAGLALEKGRVSDVIEGAGGFYLVMKTDYRDATTKPFEEVAPSLRRSLQVAKQKALQDAYMDESTRLATVELNPDNLSKVNLPRLDAALAKNNEPKPPGLPGTRDASHGN